MLAKVYRLLKSGGILVVSVSNNYSLARVLQKSFRAFGTSFRKEVYDYLRISMNDYSKTEFRSLSKQHGHDYIGQVGFAPILPTRLRLVPRNLFVFITKRARQVLNLCRRERPAIRT